jgi:hypothetical protein
MALVLSSCADDAIGYVAETATIGGVPRMAHRLVCASPDGSSVGWNSIGSVSLSLADASSLILAGLLCLAVAFAFRLIRSQIR